MTPEERTEMYRREFEHLDRQRKWRLRWGRHVAALESLALVVIVALVVRSCWP